MSGAAAAGGVEPIGVAGDSTGAPHPAARSAAITNCARTKGHRGVAWFRDEA
jgi:hypothetical protein